MYESQWEELAIGVGGENIVPPLAKSRGYLTEAKVPDKRMKLDGFTDCSSILSGGIYVLKFRKQIVYIGQSKCILSRVYTHRTNRGQKKPMWVKAMARGILFDQILMLPVKPEDRNSLEAKLIAYYKPKYNIQLKNPVDAPKLSLPPLSALVGNIIPPPAPKSEVFVRRAL